MRFFADTFEGRFTDASIEKPPPLKPQKPPARRPKRKLCFVKKRLLCLPNPKAIPKLLRRRRIAALTAHLAHSTLPRH